MKEYFEKHNFDKQLKNLIKILKDKKIVIYGTGKLFQYALKNYDFSKLNIIGISDYKYKNSQSGSIDLGYKIILRQDIIKHNPDCILIATQNYLNIMKYFVEGYGEKKVLPLVEKSFFELIKEII